MAHRALAVSVALLAIMVGCGDDPGMTGGPFHGGGSSGSGGMAGSGGIGTAGSGGTGAGGTGASAGSGGTGACVTNHLCRSCPDEFLCDDDNDCFVGWTCIPSGCEDGQGAPFKQCQPSPGGSCANNDDCRPDYECMQVPAKGDRCVKTTPGCNDSYDCVLGFSCEAGACVDRRMACVADEDCPMNHSCESPTPSTQFCARIQRTCYEDDDCGGNSLSCVDIDGDGQKECAGERLLDGETRVTCVNSGCTSSAAPVCEVSLVGSITVCGQYGLCRNDADCASGFHCVGLWPDGRKECVPSGGSCDHISDCPERQVCASSRSGGAPSCQAGAVL